MLKIEVMQDLNFILSLYSSSSVSDFSITFKRQIWKTCRQQIRSNCISHNLDVNYSKSSVSYLVDCKVRSRLNMYQRYCSGFGSPNTIVVEILVRPLVAETSYAQKNIIVKAAATTVNSKKNSNNNNSISWFNENNIWDVPQMMQSTLPNISLPNNF